MTTLPNRRSAIRLAAAALGVMLLTAVAAMASGQTVDSLPGLSLVRYAVGTLIAVGVLLLGARWLQRHGRGAGVAVDALAVVASLPVGQRERVVVVEVGGRQLLLGVAPGRVALLHELAEALPTERVAASSAAGLTPPPWLARVLGRNA